MAGKKKPSKKDKAEEVNEPAVGHGKRTIHFFNSFEEQEEFQRAEMAKLNHEELMTKLEMMRKFFLREHLLPNGKWPSLSKVITIQKPFA
jgi:hypothetical protein